MKIKAQNQVQKGVVAVEEYQTRLRLRWSYAGKRYCLYLGLPNTKLNWKAAQQKATQIELDIASGNFDATLSKYKPPSQKVIPEIKDIRIIDLFERFREYKSKSLYDRSKEKYNIALKNLRDFFGTKLTSSIKVTDVEKFTEVLSQKLSPITLKERLSIIRACWQWGIKQGLVKDNPWLDLPNRIKVPPKPLPRPFTKEEITAILNAFEKHRNYKFYLAFVKFRFMTGTRVSEATGLRWQDVADDFSQIWIGSTLTRGVRKPTKTNKARIFPCNQQLQELLKSIKPQQINPEDLVFPSPQGKAINDSLFGKRAWNTCLKIAGVQYRSFYNVRHSFISHCLESGLSPTTVAHLVGHDVQVLYENYAGSVISKPQVPVLFEY
ncbi:MULTISPECIES: tyrosine-type recombinase/integrase [Calothrix]|uniref:Tyrosine-type recombinase/integrase n=2 Tax=Calothrix TaxID=1186 RepID=A0ABR8A9Q5_9CYAN|nr:MULTISPECIES: tyrosine-type recombinase/integrase [Calothrix]MBD2196593.1 tyrosine-type recombinase/integrase [Calothrix parietina FACHB-288]MBD2228042.1 tyrosine-type recombinase/integrase [Calothrix anomala FACHB-343]